MPRSDVTATPTPLPIRRDLGPVYVSSAAIALLMALTAAVGVAFRDQVYTSEEVLLFKLPTDIFGLGVVLPLLLVSLLLATRGKLAGLLLWPGLLLYVVYIYLIFAFGVPFGATYPLYLILVALGAYTLIALVASIDAKGVRKGLAGAAPARPGGAVLIVLAVLFVAIQVPEIVGAIATRRAMEGLELAPFVGDVIVLLPAWLIGGIMLWQREPLGYLAGAPLLVLGTLLFGGLGFVLLFSALYSGFAVDWAAVAMMAAMSAVCGVPCVLFLRAAAAPSGARQT